MTSIEFFLWNFLVFLPICTVNFWLLHWAATYWPWREHLSTHHTLLASGPRASWAHPLPATPFQCPRSRTATLGEGAAATYPYVGLDCTLSQSPCGRVRPAGDLVDGDPGAVFEDGPHPGSDTGRPLEPWVCRNTRKPTVLSKVNCRPSHLNFDRFHQPCLLPGKVFVTHAGSGPCESAAACCRHALGTPSSWPSAHHRFCQSFCNFEKSWSILILCSHALLDSGFQKIFPRHDTESEKTYDSFVTN